MDFVITLYISIAYLPQQRRAVIVYCGSDSEGKRYPACLAIYDNYERIEKAGEKKPKKTLSLLGAKIEEPTYASPVGSQGSASPGANGTAFEKACQFLVISPNEVNEFRSESGDMKVHWLKLLTLLTMFPHSVIPEEPSINPINEGFKCKLVANNYGAGKLHKPQSLSVCVCVCVCVCVSLFCFCKCVCCVWHAWALVGCVISKAMEIHYTWGELGPTLSFPSHPPFS